ncbi:alpha-L-arabinofuranosidase C [Ilyonectria robusta]
MFSLLLQFALAVSSVAAGIVPPLNGQLDSSLVKKAVALPSSFQWSSTQALVGPKNDGRKIAGIKDASIVQVGGTYHVFASTAQESGYNMVYLT